MFDLLGLPLELRLRVYDHVLADHEPVCAPILPALFYTNLQICREVYKVAKCHTRIWLWGEKPDPCVGKSKGGGALIAADHIKKFYAAGHRRLTLRIVINQYSHAAKVDIQLLTPVLEVVRKTELPGFEVLVYNRFENPLCADCKSTTSEALRLTKLLISLARESRKEGNSKKKMLNYIRCRLLAEQ